MHLECEVFWRTSQTMLRISRNMSLSIKRDNSKAPKGVSAFSLIPQHQHEAMTSNQATWIVTSVRFLSTSDFQQQMSKKGSFTIAVNVWMWIVAYISDTLVVSIKLNTNCHNSCPRILACRFTFGNRYIHMIIFLMLKFFDAHAAVHCVSSLLK